MFPDEGFQPFSSALECILSRSVDRKMPILLAILALVLGFIKMPYSDYLIAVGFL